MRSRYGVVDPAGVISDEDLRYWLDTALAFVTTLPAKAEKLQRRRD